LLAAAAAPSEPIPVYTGPTRTGAALIAATAADAAEQPTRHRGKKSRVAAKKPDAASEPKNDAKNDAKSETRDAHKDAKSGAKSAAKHANAKPDAAEKPDAKPVKPKAVAKPAAKPAPKSTTGDAGTSDQKPAAAPRS
jgi:D-alanyl-D-alanine carboxypeptidase